MPYVSRRGLWGAFFSADENKIALLKRRRLGARSQLSRRLGRGTCGGKEDAACIISMVSVALWQPIATALAFYTRLLFIACEALRLYSVHRHGSDTDQAQHGLVR